jgi:transcriptional regulator of arginine metabolism
MNGTDRRGRLRAIEEIVGARPVPTQEALQNLLAERGVEVSQSTLSRDIRDLGLVKRPTPDGGTAWALPEEAVARSAAALERLLPDLLERVEIVGSFVVVGTLPGSAQPVAAAVDRAGWADVAGTVAGDDTLLVIVRSSHGARVVAERLLALADRD